MHCIEIVVEIGAKIKKEPVRDDIKAVEDHNFSPAFNRIVELKLKTFFRFCFVNKSIRDFHEVTQKSKLLETNGNRANFKMRRKNETADDQIEAGRIKVSNTKISSKYEMILLQKSERQK